MTTKASARQATPPSRNARGVEPPLVAATPETLSSIAMPGASTDMEIAMASGSRSVPRASLSAVATLGPELIWAMEVFLSLRPAALPAVLPVLSRALIPCRRAVSRHRGVLLGHQECLVVQD